MGFIKNLFKKPVPILKEEDVVELRELERVAYMKKAREVVIQRGEQRAKDDYRIKQDPWAQ